MERKQFTFYESFYKAMRKIKNKILRADIYDSIIVYALFGELPDEDKLHPAALAIFEMAKPVLDSARKKAAGGAKEKGKIQERSEKDEGKIRVRSAKDKGKEGEKEIEKENEIEKEIEKEKEIEIEVEVEIENEIEIEREGGELGARFEAFWDAYPKKADRQRAWEAFSHVKERTEVLLEALERQKRSAQWLEDGGRFIPRAAQWLQGERWLDQLSTAGPKSMQPSGLLGAAEMAAIAQMLAES